MRAIGTASYLLYTLVIIVADGHGGVRAPVWRPGIAPGGRLSIVAFARHSIFRILEEFWPRADFFFKHTSVFALIQFL